MPHRRPLGGFLFGHLKKSELIVPKPSLTSGTLWNIRDHESAQEEASSLSLDPDRELAEGSIALLFWLHRHGTHMPRYATSRTTRQCAWHGKRSTSCRHIRHQFVAS